VKFIPLFLCLFLVDAAANAQNYQPVLRLSSHEAGITVMTKDDTGKFLIAGDDKGNLYFYNLSDGSFVRKLKMHGAPVSQLQFNSTGRLLISSTRDGEIKIFDFDKEKIVQAVFSPDYSGIRFVLFSIADGFVYFNGNKRLYKTRSDLSQTVNEIRHEEDTLTDAVITTDRSALIYSCGSKLKVLNTRNDITVQEISTGSPVQRLTLLKDTTLVSWSADGTINFWKYNLGYLSSSPVFFLKGGNPSSMSFSADAQMMLSGNIGNWLRIWKPFERKIYQELYAHKKNVGSALFGTSDDIIYSGSADGEIIRWKKGAPPPDSPVAVIKKDTTAPKEKTVIPPVKDSTKVAVKETPVKQEVEMRENNVPAVIAGREVTEAERIEVNQGEITVFVYDNSFIDGDTMSLYFNGKWILDHYCVTKKKFAVNLSLLPNTNNFLVLFANNLGKTPPNTAAIEFNTGRMRKIFRLSSDLKKCSSINFYYKK
jgi:hypothetical protein